MGTSPHDRVSDGIYGHAAGSSKLPVGSAVDNSANGHDDGLVGFAVITTAIEAP